MGATLATRFLMSGWHSWIIGRLKRPKRQRGTEGRRAPNATLTEVSCTSASKVRENIESFYTCRCSAESGPDTGCAKRYAHRRFVNMSAVEQTMLRPAHFHFVNLAKTMPNNDQTKTLKIHSGNELKLKYREFQGCLRHVVMMQS